MGHIEHTEHLEDFLEPDMLEEIEEITEIEYAEESDIEDKQLVGLFKNEIIKFEKAAIPVLFLSKKLKIIWHNNSGENYFDTPETVVSKYIYQIFNPYLTEERMQEIYSNLFSRENGFSWRGKVELSGKHRITSTSNLVIFPFFIPQNGISGPEGYIAFIDDLTEENNLLLRKTFQSLLDASKLKDNDTGNHIGRVCQYSQKIAGCLYNRPGYEEVDMDFIVNIGFLAAMHDVGKIGTPDDILNKPGPLSVLEWEIMKEHTINGAFILSSYPNKMAVEIARSHHEKWDGSGYPYHLAGSDIPISARIVTIADVYDALRMKRVYKTGFSHEKSFSILTEGKGKHFDPDLIDIVMEIEAELDTMYLQLSDKD